MSLTIKTDCDQNNTNLTKNKKGLMCMLLTVLLLALETEATPHDKILIYNKNNTKHNEARYEYDMLCTFTQYGRRKKQPVTFVGGKPVINSYTGSGNIVIEKCEAMIDTITNISQQHLCEMAPNSTEFDKKRMNDIEYIIVSDIEDNFEEGLAEYTEYCDSFDITRMLSPIRNDTEVKRPAGKSVEYDLLCTFEQFGVKITSPVTFINQEPVINNYLGKENTKIIDCVEYVPVVKNISQKLCEMDPMSKEFSRKNMSEVEYIIAANLRDDYTSGIEEYNTYCKVHNVRRGLQWTDSCDTYRRGRAGAIGIDGSIIDDSLTHFHWHSLQDLRFTQNSPIGWRSNPWSSTSYVVLARTTWQRYWFRQGVAMLLATPAWPVTVVSCDDVRPWVKFYGRFIGTLYIQSNRGDCKVYDGDCYQIALEDGFKRFVSNSRSEACEVRCPLNDHDWSTTNSLNYKLRNMQTYITH